MGLIPTFSRMVRHKEGRQNVLAARSLLKCATLWLYF